MREANVSCCFAVEGPFRRQGSAACKFCEILLLGRAYADKKLLSCHRGCKDASSG